MAKRSAPPSSEDGPGSRKAARGGNHGGSTAGTRTASSAAGGRRGQKDMSPNAGAAAGRNSNSAAAGGDDGSPSSSSPNPNAGGDTDMTAGANTGAGGSSAAASAAGTKDEDTPNSRPSSRLSTRSSPDEKSNSGGGGSNGSNSHLPREVQVTELLAHRRLLLERIRRCRAAAAKRLEEVPSRSVASMSNSNSNSSGSAANDAAASASASPTPTPPANELESFKLLTQQAVAATKRERQSSVAALGIGMRDGGAASAPGGGEARGGLRGRGAGGSVGKRMAAAVSTLQNAGSIGGWVSDSSTGTGASGSTSAATAGTSKGKAAGGGAAASAAAGASASAGKKLPATTASTVALEGGGKKGKKRPKASESPPPTGAGAAAAAGGEGGAASSKAKKSKSGGDKDKKKKGGSGSTGSSVSQPQQTASAAAMRQHHQNALAALGQSDPGTLALLSRPRGQEARILKQYAANPRVVHPQGRSLRARREALRDRLEKVVAQRREREARLLGQGLDLANDTATTGAGGKRQRAIRRTENDNNNSTSTDAAAPPPPTGESPISVADKMTTGSALAELVKIRPQFKTYALEQASASATASAVGQPLSRASTPTPGGPGRRSPVPPSSQPQQPYRPERRNPSAGNRPTPRRKTHWDYVLEEMKWTATDFESERRWKGAVGRTLGASVLAFHAANGGGKGSPLKSGKSMGTKAQGGSAKKKKRKTEGSEDDTALAVEAEEEDLEPTVEDLDRARIISKGLSILIAGHWDLATEANASSTSSSTSHDGTSLEGAKKHTSHDDAVSARAIYRRYKEVVRGIPGMGESKTMQIDSDSPADSIEEEEEQSTSNPSHEIVTTRLEAALKRANLVGTQPSKKKRPVESADCTVELQPSQVDAIHFVEAVWEVECSDDDASTLGVALSGKVASGKTVAMAAAIWRHGEEGPQILFCHSARLIRWRHELRRLGDLNVLTYGNLGWQFDGDQARSFKAGDVILCEFSSLPDLLANVGKGIITRAATITIDSRCPESDALSQRSNAGVSLQKIPSAAISQPEVASSEVTSTKWWKHLLHALTSPSVTSKRLFIEGPTALEDIIADSTSNSNSKKRVELLAMKMAFVHHPRTFCAGHGNVGRSVISWAKKRHRATTQKENLSAKTDLEALKAVLRESFAPLCHTQEMYEQPKAKQQPPPSWELRLCTFPELQRQAYEECCSFVRGSLSLSSLRLMGITASSTAPRAQRNAQTLWAQAILRLRRVCVHSDLDEAAQASPLALCSSSQLENAKNILMNSAKMQQLAAVLLTECGHVIGSGESDSDDLSHLLPGGPTTPAGGTSKKTKRKKVLILAALPEAQAVVSKLLSSLGIAHGKLRSSSPSQAGANMASDEASVIDSLAWIENQHILSRFNARSDVTSSSGPASRTPPSSSACDVLIASPLTIGSQYGGLSASAADVVISLDEDWSGHSQGLIESILARNLMHHCLLENPSASKPRPKWIKLVCDNSCEKIFLFPEGDPAVSVQDEADDDEPEEPSPPKKKPKRGGGRKPRKGKATEKVVEKKATPSKASGASQGLAATFISSFNVLQFRDKALTSVLGKHCSFDESYLSDPSDSIFLPTLSAKDSNDGPDAVIAPYSDALLHEEALASSFLGGIEDSTDSNVPVAALSPLSISRRDASSICVRTYVQQITKALSSSASGANKQPSTLFGAASRLRISGSDTDLANSWRQSGLGRDPVEMAASALSLRPEVLFQDDSANFDLAALVDVEGELTLAMHDGTEGQDELVYFPPSFPSMLLNAYRKMSEEEQKRRHEQKSAAAGADSATSTTGVSAFMGGKQAAGSKGNRPRNSKGARSSTAAPLTPTALTNTRSPTVSSTTQANAVTPMAFAEDFQSTVDMAFGMSGLPDSRTSAQSAAKTLTGCLSYPYLDEEAVDAGDADVIAEMGSMLLFTKKGTNLLRRASSLMPTYNAYGIHALATGGKKPKKGSLQQQPMAVMQGNGPPTGNDSTQRMTQIWDSRALNLLAQRGINPQRALRHASVRMRHRLNDRVTQLFITTGTSLGTGHGVPQLYANEAAALGGSASRPSLKRALNAPCRTDFGPFNVGFLAAKEGMVGIKPKKRKLGISLPMGVRLPQHRDPIRPFPGAADEKWSKDQDDQLIDSVLTWKDNWHLIANAVSHSSDGLNVWEKGGRYRSIKSPKECRERWATLLQSRQNLQSKWSAVEKKTNALIVPGGARNALRSALEDSEAHPLLVLFSAKEDGVDVEREPREMTIGIVQSSLLLRRAVGDIVNQAKEDKAEKAAQQGAQQGAGAADEESTGPTAPRPDQDDVISSPKKASTGSRLARMKRAMLKRQKPKLQLPGAPLHSGSGGHAIPLVASHPSHAQAVEYAVTQATGASGMAPPRMDMWPLQVIDYADRIRCAKTGEPMPTPRYARARSSGSAGRSAATGTSPTPSSSRVPSQQQAAYHPSPHGAMQHQRVPGQQPYAPQGAMSHGSAGGSQPVPSRGGGPLGSYVPAMPPHGSKPTVVGASGIPIRPANQNAPPPPASAGASGSSNRHVPPLPRTAANGGRPSTSSAASTGPASAPAPAASASSQSPPPTKK